MSKKENKNRGITLIALVITIIVMLIIAGVAISAITTDGVPFGKMQEAADKYTTESQQEADSINTLFEMLNSYNGEDDSKIKLEYTIENILDESRVIGVQVNLKAIIDESINYWQNPDISYEEYATKILEGKTIKEKEEIFLEASNYYSDEIYDGMTFSTLDEIYQYEYNQGWTSKLCTSLQEYAEDYEYASIDEMLIYAEMVKPVGYDFENEKVKFSLMANEKELNLKDDLTAIYIISENGTYTFELFYGEYSSTIKININNIENNSANADYLVYSKNLHPDIVLCENIEDGNLDDYNLYTTFENAYVFINGIWQDISEKIDIDDTYYTIYKGDLVESYNIDRKDIILVKIVKDGKSYYGQIDMTWIE